MSFNIDEGIEVLASNAFFVFIALETEVAALLAGAVVHHGVALLADLALIEAIAYAAVLGTGQAFVVLDVHVGFCAGFAGRFAAYRTPWLA